MWFLFLEVDDTLTMMLMEQADEQAAE